MSRHLPPLLSLTALGLLGLSTAIAADSAATANPPAEFTVIPAVAAKAPMRIGFNFQTTGHFDITTNVLLTDGGFSSYDVRFDYTATEDGAADGTTFIANDTKAAGARFGTDFYDSLTSKGAFDGAQARVYRFDDKAGEWHLVRTGIIAGMTAVHGSTAPVDHAITFTTPGVRCMAGDALWLARDGVFDRPDAYHWVDMLSDRFQGQYHLPWTPGLRNAPASCTASHVTDVPPGQTNGKAEAPPLSLQITAKEGPAGLWRYTAPDFEAGHSYVISLWMKQSGIADGAVTFALDQQRHTFAKVTDTWQKFTYTFTGLTFAGKAVVAQLSFTGPGTLWLNQVQLYDASRAPGTLDPRTMQTFADLHPGVVRIWSGFGNSSYNYSFWSLDSWLQDDCTCRGTPNIGTGSYGSQQPLKLPSSLAMCRQLGADPWLICEMDWSEKEWSEFIDYLAAPAGVGFAARRPDDHPGPYTADFARIYLEFGNEEWGTQKTAVNGHYGEYAHYMLHQALAGKSWPDLAKLKLVLNNFTVNPAFGNQAMEHCPEAQGLDFFLYTGNRKFTGDAGYANDLLSIQSYQPRIDAWMATAAKSAAAGHPYEVTSYEGGNGSDDPTSKGDGDLSLAAATGQLDVYLYAQQSGMTALNFFGYRLGKRLYCSHTDFAHGYIPHPIWEALSMRNRYCAGDMVTVACAACPSTADGHQTPLIGVYAFHDHSGGGDQADIVVISRDLDHATPVTVNLPAAATGDATLHTLTGDPRANNLDRLNVPIGTSTIKNVGRTIRFTMPAGSVYLFQVPTGPWQ